MAVHVGCCGMQMARGKYFRRFALTEVQQTFYQPPQAATLAKWREEAPADFEFTLKAWQLITHAPTSRKTYKRLKVPVPAEKEGLYGGFKPTEEVMEAWRVTRESARALGARFVLFQCPASFTPTKENVGDLRGFFQRIRPERGDLIFGWEPRGAWDRGLIRELVEELDLVYVVDPFVNEPMDEQGGMRYLRLHGQAGTNFRYTYTDEELRRLLKWCREGTYVLFNNVPMVQDAERFIRMLDGKYSGPSGTMEPRRDEPKGLFDRD